MNDTIETDIDEWRRDYEKNFDSKYRGASKTPPTAQTVTSILKHHDRPVKQPEATSKDEPDEASQVKGALWSALNLTCSGNITRSPAHLELHG